MQQQRQQRPGYQQYSAPYPPRGSLNHAPPPPSVIHDRRDTSLVSEVVPVPPELLEWVSGSKVQAMFLKVKEASGIGYITSMIDGAGASIMIHSPTETAAKIARMLVEINFKEQMKYQHDMQRLHQMQESLFEVQGAVASGLRIEFTVPRELIGIIIGKKGSRIQEVQRETGVSDIHIDGDTGTITITGPSPNIVQRARELVDLVEEKVPLPAGRGELLARDISSLNDIRDMSKCIIARVPPGEDCVVLIGTRPAITSAKLIVDTQIEYMMKRAQLYESEQSIRQQLSTLRHNNNGPRGDNSRPRNNYNNPVNNNNRRRGNLGNDSRPPPSEANQKKEVNPQANVPPPPPQQQQSQPQSQPQQQPSQPQQTRPITDSLQKLSSKPINDSASKGFSPAELQKKLSALAVSADQNMSSKPVAPPKTTSSNSNESAAKVSSSQSAEDGLYTSKRSRNIDPSAARPNSVPNSVPASASDLSKPKPVATRGVVSNKVTKPNGRADTLTLRDAIEAKKSPGSHS